MSEFASSVILGVVQGLTEFLPVSSSGHLVLAQAILPGFKGPAAAFDVLLHAGTLAAVVVFFRSDLLSIAGDLGRPAGWRLPLLLVVASLPAGIVGVLLADTIEPLFRSPAAASLGLIVTSLLLIAAGRNGAGARGGIQDISFYGAFLVGLFQALAIVPGISRSGATIAAAMFLGISGREAARFSFLLSLPAVAGALILKIGNLAGNVPMGSYAAGAGAAAVVGITAIALLMRLLDRGRLFPFAAYCFALGSLSLVILV